MSSQKSATEARVQEILRWQMLGKSVDEIADLLGIAPRTVTEHVRSDRYKQLQAQYLEGTYAQVDRVIKERKANVMLEEAASHAAEALIDLLDAKQEVLTADGQVVKIDLSPADKRLTSIAILDRSGYGPIQRKAVRTRIEMDPVLMKLMTEALRDSQIIEVEARDVTRSAITGPDEQSE